MAFGEMLALNTTGATALAENRSNNVICSSGGNLGIRCISSRCMEVGTLPIDRHRRRQSVMTVKSLLNNSNILVIAKFLVILNVAAFAMGALYFGISDESIGERISWISLVFVLPLTLWYSSQAIYAKGSYLSKLIFGIGLVAHTVEIGKRIAYRVSDIDIGISVLFCLAYLLVWYHILCREDAAKPLGKV
jgi:hypothetical protein